MSGSDGIFSSIYFLGEKAFCRNCIKRSGSALLGTKSLPAAKNTAKTFTKQLIIWTKVQGKADISKAVLHFKTARNAKTVKISVALEC